MDSIWWDDFHRSYDSVTCKCGNTTYVALEIEVVEKQEPVSDEAVAEFQRDFVENPGGRQIHATQCVSRGIVLYLMLTIASEAWAKRR